jgi:hypothetical protein
MSACVRLRDVLGGLFALAGVVIGGVITWSGQLAMLRRNNRVEWVVATRR